MGRQTEVYYGVNQDTLPELRARMKGVYLQVKKDDVLPELPPKTIIEVPLNVHIHESLDLLNEARARLEGRGAWSDELSVQRRRIGEEKAEYVAEWCNNVSEREPLLIACWHRSVAAAIAEKLDAETKVLIGGMDNDYRQSVVDAFQRGNFTRLVCTIGAAGAGLTLTAANIVCLAELPWTAAETKQMADRVHRIGQDRKVFEYRFVAVGSEIDKLVARSIETKAADAASVIR